MRRNRRPSFGRDASTTTVSGGVDQKRRTELLAEARRKRVAWVEEARGVDEGLNGARRRKETEAAENGKKAESELERVSSVHKPKGYLPTGIYCPRRLPYSWYTCTTDKKKWSTVLY